MTQQACPLWVPLVENDETHSAGAAYFVRDSLGRLFAQDEKIDTLLLGCTHYPLLLPFPADALPTHVKIVEQGGIVAKSLADYLRRHSEMKSRLRRGSKRIFLTTGDAEDFSTAAMRFYGEKIMAQRVELQ